MNNTVGIFWILANIPIWGLTFLLFLVTHIIINEIHRQIEGFPYAISRAGLYGDAGLNVAVIIAATVYVRAGVVLPVWLRAYYESVSFHVVLGILSLVVGFLLFTFSRQKLMRKSADIYHDLGIVSLFTYFAGTLLPVVYYGGSGAERWATFALILFWVLMVIVDARGKCTGEPIFSDHEVNSIFNESEGDD